MRVADQEEAIRLANDSAYGLSASVWTGSRIRGQLVARSLEVGAVNVNNVLANVFQLSVPFGGWKQSGIGSRFGGPDSILKYCRKQALVEERLQLRAEPYWYPHSRRRVRFQRRVVRLLGAHDWRRRLR